MNDFDFLSYAEGLAGQLKAVGHSDGHCRFFPSFGLEDLVFFSDRLSSLEGFVMIAIDGHESESSDNHADALDASYHYGVIICRNTVADDPSSISSAFSDCERLCREVRNRMLLELRPRISRDTEINGIGPIGDNFYGCLLSFTMVDTEGFAIDQTCWKQDEPAAAPAAEVEPSDGGEAEGETNQEGD
jgi:hypothetical protein